MVSIVLLFIHTTITVAASPLTYLRIAGHLFQQVVTLLGLAYTEIVQITLTYAD